MWLKKAIGVFLLLGVSLTVQGQGEDFHFVLFTNQDHSLYLFDGTSANQITGDEWVVTYTTTETAILAVTDTVSGQNILEYDLNGEFQSALTDFDADNTPIWVDLADIPSSDELIGGFERIGALEGGLYRFDPGNVFSSLSYIGEGSNPDVSSDGRFLVFDRSVQRLTDLDTPYVYSAVVLYNLETKAWVYVTSELQGSCAGAQWHPTQNKVVYICARVEDVESTLRTYVTDIDSAETEQLPLPPGRKVYGCAVVWSSDGSAIAYNTESGIAVLSLESMTFEFLDYPSALVDEGVSCIKWLP